MRPIRVACRENRFERSNKDGGMVDFRQLTDSFWASPQISVDDVPQAAQDGFAMVVNNRPDGEEPGQPEGAEIAAAAAAAGLEYRAIPVTGAGFSEAQVTALQQELQANPGKILAYCRSGTRSTLLWALTRASMGGKPDDIARQALAAGYDVTPVRPALDMIAVRAGEG
jgi:uncharacterized protein (TIGR01244 family)